jgi:glycosyltransferase involved in cell wall biosynthesis
MSSRVATESVAGRVSAVVTTRNSADTLGDCLESIRAQTYDDVELVVVDNQSTDVTREIADRFADVVLDAGPERSAQRNHGVEASSGEYVLIVDSDMILLPRVVAQCVALAVSEQAVAIVVPERSIGDGFLARAKALERSCYLGDAAIEAARFFAREAFDRYGGYDERLTGPEDWDLPARMRARERSARVEEMILHQEGNLRLRPLLRKKFYYGKSAYRYAQRHPELARKQLTPFRGAFVRNWRLLARRPVLSAAMLGMKAAELGAGGLGMLSEAIDRPDRASR